MGLSTVAGFSSHRGLQGLSARGRLAGLDIGEADVKDHGLLEAYYFSLECQNLRPSTIIDYTERLNCLVKLAIGINKNLLELTQSDIQHFLVDMVQRLSPVTINGRRKDWSLFYSFVEKQGLTDNDWQNPMAGIPKMREPKRIHRLIRPDEYSDMLRKYSPSFFQGMRNQCMMLIAWDTMLRRQEMLSIKMDDLELRPHRLLTVTGKGNKQRVLAFSAKTAMKLSIYLNMFREKIGGDLLFCSKFGTAIDKRHAHRIFSNAGEKCGLPMKTGPHLVRRSSATHYWRKTGNIYLVSQILGHANVAITEQYVQAGVEDIMNAYGKSTPADDLTI